MMKRIKTLIAGMMFITCFSSCESLNQIANSLGISEYEMIAGLKDALTQGMFKSIDAFADPNGNPLVRFAFPGDAAKIEQSLRQMGLSSAVDKVTGKFTRAAASAVNVAKPMLINSIKQMTIRDALNILVTDNPHAATDYFKTTNKDMLLVAFRPIVDSTIKVENANVDWSKIVSVYNLIPMNKQPLEKDLTDFIAARAIDGMFIMIGDEEKQIREKYEFRKTDMMKKAFGYAEEELKKRQGK